MPIRTVSDTIAIDFGTSNSAAGVLVDGRPVALEIEAGQDTLPTSVFFDFGDGSTVFGNRANAALIDGREGRYMRSLKSVLGTSLMHEKRQIMGEKLSFVDIIGRFLKEVKTKAEAACNKEFHVALSGRPVHFHSGDARRDAQALADLTQCYARAGFQDVQFLYEPEAAALANSDRMQPGDTGLIVDIGGGTSDFSLFRARRGGIDIIASHGVRVGGTDFDRTISIENVMPLFGKGSRIGREMGAGTFAAPNGIFNELATWQKIPFLYNGETRRDVAMLTKLAVAPERLVRLAAVLEQQLGHDVAFAVERGKIDANRTTEGAAIALGIVEPGLKADLSPADLDHALAAHVAAIRACALETLEMAQCRPDAVQRVIFVGGSSLMGAVSGAIAGAFPGAKLDYFDAFTAIVDGLAIAAARPDRQL